jgi:hypothetical protein
MKWKKADSALLAQLDALGPNVARRELLAALQAWAATAAGGIQPGAAERVRTARRFLARYARRR